jgi:hypothetical protein
MLTNRMTRSNIVTSCPVHEKSFGKSTPTLVITKLICSNVFCRPLDEICVPEMDAMYRRLEKKGVQGFHFVVSSRLAFYDTANISQTPLLSCFQVSIASSPSMASLPVTRSR